MKKQYKPIVCMIVIRIINNGKYMLLQQRRRPLIKIKYDTFWELPQGKIKAGESIQEAIKRELFEESRLNLISIVNEQISSNNIFGVGNCELFYPFCSVRIDAPYPMIGHAFIVEADGVPKNTFEAFNHKWMDHDMLKNVYLENKLFPLNIPMIEKIIKENVLEV